MSMMASFRQASPSVLQQLHANPDWVEAALDFGEDASVARAGLPAIDLDKAFAHVPEAMRQMMRAQMEKAFAPKGPNPLEAAGVTPDDLPEPLEIDKAWHGLHFLLCGSAGVTADPLAQVVMGGEELGEDIGYGPMRVHGPKQVAALATALEAVDEATLTKRFNPKAMTELYPAGGWSREELVWLLGAFREVRDYYVQARERGHGMLLYLR